MNDNPVLICYDGSDDAKLAIERAGDLFEARRAIVLTAWQSAYLQIAPYALSGVAYATDLEDVDSASAESAAKRAKEGTELARAAGLRAEPVCVKTRGPIWRTVLDVADERDAAVIVMGSRGLSGIKSLMLGSVSGSVVHHASRPTLVVRHGVPALPSDQPAGLAEPIIG